MKESQDYDRRSATWGFLNSGFYFWQKEDFEWIGVHPGVGKDWSGAMCATAKLVMWWQPDLLGLVQSVL